MHMCLMGNLALLNLCLNEHHNINIPSIPQPTSPKLSGLGQPVWFLETYKLLIPCLGLANHLHVLPHTGFKV